jgi:hypothetical protein
MVHHPQPDMFVQNLDIKAVGVDRRNGVVGKTLCCHGNIGLAVLNLDFFNHELYLNENISIKPYKPYWYK